MSDIPQWPLSFQNFTRAYITNTFPEIGCADVDDPLDFSVTSSNGKVFKRTDLRIGEVIYKFLSYNISTFYLFALNAFSFIFLFPMYWSYMENIERIKRCDNSRRSLHFKPNLHIYTDRKRTKLNFN